MRLSMNEVISLIDDMRELYGDKYILDELIQAMSIDELNENFEWIANENDFDTTKYEKPTILTVPRLTPYERTRNYVYATGNKWAIENFNATH